MTVPSPTCDDRANLRAGRALELHEGVGIEPVRTADREHSAIRGGTQLHDASALERTSAASADASVSATFAPAAATPVTATAVAGSDPHAESRRCGLSRLPVAGETVIEVAPAAASAVVVVGDGRTTDARGPEREACSD